MRVVEDSDGFPGADGDKSFESHENYKGFEHFEANLQTFT